jgi:predicted site-specific integrase-resolvase
VRGVSALLVTRPERLARFGTGSVERLLSYLGATIEVVGEDAEVTDTRESELVSDMLAVVSSFSGRLYGARSARARALRAAVVSAAVAEEAGVSVEGEGPA